MPSHGLRLSQRRPTGNCQRDGRVTQAVRCQAARIDPGPPHGVLDDPADRPACHMAATVLGRAAWKQRRLIGKPRHCPPCLNGIQCCRHQHDKRISFRSPFALNPQDMLASFQANGGSLHVEHVIDTLDWWGTYQSGDADTAKIRLRLAMLDVLVQHGARWIPKDRRSLDNTRRRLLRVAPEFILEVIRIMAKHGGCRRGVIACRILRSASTCVTGSPTSNAGSRRVSSIRYPDRMTKRDFLL